MKVNHQDWFWSWCVFNLRRFLAILAVAGVWVGCASPGPHVPGQDERNPEAAGAPVVVFDPDLRNRISVDEPVRTRRDSQGRLVVQTLVRNRTARETLHLQVQTLFRNEKGMVLETASGGAPAWENLTLSPGQTGVVEVGALTPEAERFTIRIRRFPRSP